MESTKVLSSGNYQDSSSFDKYHGLIKPSLMKQLSQYFYSFFSYIYTVGNDFDTLNAFMRIWRVWAALTPALCVNFPFYDRSSFAFHLANVIATPTTWIPVGYRGLSAYYFVLVYGIILILFDISMQISAVLLAKRGMLSNTIPNIYIFLCASIMLIINFPASNLLGECIGRLISGQDKFSAFFCFVLVIGLLGYYCFSQILKKYISISVSFRPYSLMTVSYKTQIAAFSLPTSISLFLGIASELSKIPRIILMCIAIILYVFLLCTPFYQGGYVYLKDETAVQTIAGTAMVSLLMFIIQDAVGTKVSSVQIFGIFLFFIIVIVVSRVVNNRIRTKYASILDDCLDDIANFEEISKANRYINILAYGFSIAHPACINWSMCQAACEKWQKDVIVWFAFLKFVAIYPDQNFHIASIFKYFSEIKQSSTTKQIQTEIIALMRLREGNLSIFLKEKLNSITREVNSAKHKLRNIWDIVIQGNVNEMEKAIANTYEAIKTTRIQYNHLLRQYPNNRFITRSYSRFLLEVCADIKTSMKYDSDTKLIHKGILANPDKTHILGIKAYPNLPDSLSKPTNPINMLLATSEDTGTDLGTDDSTADEQMIGLEQEIEGITFPKIRAVNIIRFIFLIVLWIIPLIVIAVYGTTSSSKVSDPLVFIEYVGRLAAYSYLLPLLSQQLVLETIGTNIALNVTGIGSKDTTKGMLQYIITQTTDYVGKMTDFESYQVGNSLFDTAREYLYVNMYDYKKYKEDLTYETKKFPTISQITEIAVSATSVIKNIDSITTLDNMYVMDQVINSYGMTLGFNGVAEKIIEFTNDYQARVQKTIVFMTIFVFVLSTIIWIIGGSIAIRQATKEKEVIFKSLTVLPKNVISSIIDKLKLINKGGAATSTNNSESDINKQEDNIIKILATAGDSNSNSETFTFVNGLSICVGIIEFLIVSVLLTIAVTQKISRLKKSAPQIKNIIFSCTHELGASIPLLSIFGKGSSLDSETAKSYAMDMKNRFQSAIDALNIIRYGDSDSSIEPFDVATEKFKKVDIDGLSPEMAFMSKSVLINKVFALLSNSKDSLIVSDKIYMLMTNDILLFTKFYAPICTTAVDTVLETANSYTIPVLVLIVIVIILLIIQEFIILNRNLVLQQRLRFTLKLLMHCPIQVIQQSQRIMSVLAGNFDTHRTETATRGSDYFLEIINNMPDGFIVATKKEGITLMNNSAKRLFGEQTDPLAKVSDLFQDVDVTKFNELKDGSVLKTTYKTKDGDTLNLEILLSIQDEESIYTVIDNTQTIRYNQLIAEERQRSDLLLTSILPPKLVPRVQAGEKDISFEVQTASVLFMDIVEFTPWCASHEASFVMTTLNRLFTEFDDLVSRSSTLTRIKCIGDCYMAAGGIFSEMNQPEVHAREAVKFGADAISCVQRVNQEIDQNLRIRVGINTGGPLVAGVIGTGKPTFEIIGPVINMAQQMEHHGVPMQVHISRSVYELIYGSSNFVIKERGQIEIKNGTAVTYLVSEVTS